MSHQRVWLLRVALAAAAIRCVQAGEADPVAVARSAIIYGQDGRSEPWEVPSETLRLIAATANVALIDEADVRVSPDGQVRLPSDTAEDLLGLCADEPFAQQPAAARCTGVLVARNLVLTAAHCARRLRCEDMVVVRGFAYEEEDQLRPLASGDLARCARVLHTVPTYDEHGVRSLDYAWLELKGDLDPGAPLQVQPEELIAPGTAVALIGHGLGLPVKIDDGGTVVSMKAPIVGQLRARIDNFSGGSGAGVFDEAGNLLGIAVNGASDLEPTDAGCLRSRRLEDHEGMEVVTLAEHALDGLCDVVPDAEPCGARPAAHCALTHPRGRTTGSAATAVAGLMLATWLARTRRARSMWNRRTDRDARRDYQRIPLQRIGHAKARCICSLAARGHGLLRDT